MKVITITELMVDAERELKSVLGSHYQVISREAFGEANYRGGFQLVFSSAAGDCEVVYSDMQLEAKCNGKELFGVTIHEGFEGNMFSREPLREYLPRMAVSISDALRQRYALG